MKSTKERRAEKALEHIKEMEKKYGDSIKKSYWGSKIYHGRESFGVETYSRFTEPTEIQVIDSDTVTALFKNTDNTAKVALLNFASYKYAGGGFIRGSLAQEESICHASTLYNVLKDMDDMFYEEHREDLNSGLYRDEAIFSPYIKFFKPEYKPREASVITCAAVNKNAAEKKGITEVESSKAMQSRVNFIMDIAVERGVDTLILGAYGCGVFGSNPHKIAGYFARYIIEHPFAFKKIVFAIPVTEKDRGKPDSNYEAFKKEFSLYSTNLMRLFHNL